MWPDEKLKIARRCGAKDHSWMDRCRKTSMWRAPPTYPSNYALDTNFEFITLGYSLRYSTLHSDYGHESVAPLNFSSPASIVVVDGKGEESFIPRNDCSLQ